MDQENENHSQHEHLRWNKGYWHISPALRKVPSEAK
jgi:hypothetical protein